MSTIDIQRRKTRAVQVGSVQVGGDAPISIQSMTNTKTADVEATVAQIERMVAAGVDIVRVTVNDQAAADGFAQITQRVGIPIVADIHFDYKMALAAIKGGAAKIRINPGNIGGLDKAKIVIDACKEAGVAVRIGVNGGSLSKELLKKYGHPTPEALVESALEYVALMESLDFDQFIISLKTTDVPSAIAATELFASKSDVPQHIGITEAGTLKTGTIKSAAGLGAILSRGIGDTMRVSLSADPVEEISVAAEILKAYGLKKGPKIIACPTCGRTDIDLVGLAEEVERRMKDYDTDINVAVMGCIVNGPGEAKEADIGIAGGNGKGLLIVKGEVVKTVPEDQIIDELMLLVDKIDAEQKAAMQ